MARPPSPPKKPPHQPSKALAFALDMVEAMADADLVTMPGDPTPAMLRAGAEAGSITQGVARKVYIAMINAG